MTSHWKDNELYREYKDLCCKVDDINAEVAKRDAEIHNLKIQLKNYDYKNGLCDELIEKNRELFYLCRYEAYTIIGMTISLIYMVFF